MPKKSNEELYEEAERELYTEAIRQTDQEIFDDVLNRDPDDNDGNNDLEQMDDDDAPTGDEEPTDEEEGEEPDESEEGEAEESEEGDEGEDREAGDRRDGRGQERVPPSRLREEAASRRAAEAEARELRARLEALERNQRPPPQQQPEQPQRPDIFADPEGWERQTRAEIENSIATRYVNASLADARDEHGEKFDEAFKAITSLDPRNPADQATVVQIYNSPNPGKALMRWHERQQLVREIGPDPRAFRNKVAQELMNDPEFRQQFLETMRGDAMNGNRGAQPRTRVRLPASLNGASGGSGHRSRDPRPGRYTTTAADERDIFDSAFDN